MSNKWFSPSLTSRLRTLGARGLDLLFPPICAGCDRAGYALCPFCAQEVEPVGEPICAHCGRRQTHAVERCSLCALEDEPPLDLVRAATLHRWPLREAIHALKYEGRTELARPLARYLFAVLDSPPWPHLLPRIDAVVPAPLHARRRAERGYNQATLLARPLCQWTGLPLRTDWLQRTQMTRPQVGLNARERRANVADAFRASPAVRDKTLLLIDDVYTTGATMTACAAAAKKAGARAVYGLALAQPVRSASPAPKPEMQALVPATPTCPEIEGTKVS